MGLLAPGPGIMGADCLANPLGCQQGSSWAPHWGLYPSLGQFGGQPITVFLV